MGTADDLKKLGEDIVASYDTRIREVGQLAKDTHKMLKEFEREHKERAGNLRADLARGEDNRIKAFESMLEETQQAINDIEIDVKNKLKEFSGSHANMSVELKKELAGYMDEMGKAAKKLRSDIQKRQKERNAEVTDLLEGFRAEREKMVANWKTLTATMAMRRRGHSAPFRAKESEKVTTGKEVFGENKLHKKVAKGKRQIKRGKH
ncbi:MAG: hypothetical protein ABIK83_04125 [Candidatus Zixiibacteriota bacterium]